MSSKALGTSKVGLAYIKNSVITLYKKIDINLRARLCSGHYAIHNSVSLTWLQLPDSCLLYQASLPYVKFLDLCHSAHDLCQRHILLSAKCTGIWSFLYYQEDVLFLFPENMILMFRHKRKDDLSQKNTGNIFSSDVLKRWSFQKIHAWTWSFFVISGKMVFLFSRKYYIFCLGGKWKKMIFIKKRVKIWHFLYVCVGVSVVALSSSQENKDAPKKYT